MMSYRPAFLRPCLTLAAMALCGTANAVTYDDGLTHTIPGDPNHSPGDPVALENGSSLIVEAGGLITGDVTTGIPGVRAEAGTTLDVRGGTIAGDSTTGSASATAGLAVSGAAGATFLLQGGTVTGGDATATFNAINPSTSLTAHGGAGLITAGAFSAIGGAITGGRGHALGAFFDPTVTHTTATGGVGLYLLASHGATLQNLSVTGGEALSQDGAVYMQATSGHGLRIAQSQNVHIAGGSYVGGEATTGRDLFFDGFRGEGVTTSGHGVHVLGGTSLTIDNGYFQAGTSWANAWDTATAESGDGLRIDGNADVTIHGGEFYGGVTFTMLVSGGGEHTSLIGAGLAVGDVPTALSLTITGGRFQGKHGLVTRPSTLTPADATIDIYGGDLLGFNSDGDLNLANALITTAIHGHSFLLDDNPIENGDVTATIGTLSGILASGEAFEWTFQRAPDAPLVLIPEPATLTALALATLALGRRPQRRPQRRP